MYHYFVSFSILRNGQLGFGNTEVTHDHPITCYNDIRDFESCIRKKIQDSCSYIAILHYNLMSQD